jgi:large subunit ribosomal protein L19
MNPIVKKITEEQLKANRLNFKVGDEICVSTIVSEGDKERIQKFSGIVIAVRSGGIQQSFTVRRILNGIGVEMVYPLNAPTIKEITVERESVRLKARMYYLRDRIGKKASKVKEKKTVRA